MRRKDEESVSLAFKRYDFQFQQGVDRFWNGREYGQKGRSKKD
jgi:hypothetical protein